MRDVSAPPPEPAPEKHAHVRYLIVGGLLLVVAVLPPDISWFFALIAVPVLWFVFAVPITRSFTRNCIAGGEKVLFGLMAIILAGFAAVLLVGCACAVPMSRFNPH